MKRQTVISTELISDNHKHPTWSLRALAGVDRLDRRLAAAVFVLLCGLKLFAVLLTLAATDWLNGLPLPEVIVTAILAAAIETMGAAYLLRWLALRPLARLCQSVNAAAKLAALSEPVSVQSQGVVEVDAIACGVNARTNKSLYSAFSPNMSPAKGKYDQL